MMFYKRILIIAIVALAIIGCEPSSTSVTSSTQPSAPTLAPPSAATVAPTIVPTTAPTATTIPATATDSSKPYTVGPGPFVNDILELAGGVNVFANGSTAYPQVSAEQVVSANPEVIILPDAAYGITVESVLQRPGWQKIDAVKNKHIYPIDDALVSRPGPRGVDGLEAAAKLIHPELFH